MLYCVRLFPYDKKHKWQHYKNLIHLIKRSHNAVIATDFIWFIELEETSLASVCSLYTSYIKPRDKIKAELRVDVYSWNIYKRSIGELV